jgi:hypothetical protein
MPMAIETKAIILPTNNIQHFVGLLKAYTKTDAVKFEVI